MKRFLFVLLIAATALAQDKSSYTVSDIVLLGLGERHVIFYSSNNNQKLNAQLQGQEYKLELQPTTSQTRGLSIPGGTAVNGTGSWKLPISSTTTAFTVRRVGDTMVVQANTNLRSIYYWDGSNWFTVLERLNAGKQQIATPKIRSGLLGAANLWRDEATALETYLKPRGAFFIATLPEDTLDGNETTFSPAPTASRRSVLAVQLGYNGMWLQQTTSNTTNPVLGVTASSAFSGYKDTTFWARVDSSNEDFTRTWQVATAGQSPTPALPNIDFATRRIITVFLGKKASTGYNLGYKTATLERGTLKVSLELREPSTLNTTPSSPFIMLEVAAKDIQVVQVELVK